MRHQGFQRGSVALQNAQRAFELGVNFIDTADAYGPFVSELLVRETLAPYTGMVVATKGGFLIKLILIFKKAVIFIVVGIGGFFKWLFGRKKKDDGSLVVHEPPAPPPSDPNGPPPSV